MKRIYLDHNATTSLDPEVLKAMMPYLTGEFGNASSIYECGRMAQKAVVEAREKVARLIGAQSDELFFTSGGTEADNWALKGAAEALRDKGNHIITTVIEHHAVLHTCEYLEEQGFEVTYLPVDEYGLVDPAAVEQAITDQTIIVSVMYANNEIGTIEPVEEIGKIVKEKGILYHIDAVQAVGKIPVDVNAIGVDLLSMSAHKLYGPKGVGALYIRKGVKINNLLHGGAQERNQRAGTENVAGIVGFGKAAELSCDNLIETAERLTRLGDRLAKGITEKMDHVRFNGYPLHRLPGHVNVSIEFVEGEALVMSLDMQGISVSSGSACAAGSADPSHVLLAIGLPHEIAHGSLRMTLGKDSTEADVDEVLTILPRIVEKLRAMSPLYQ